MLKLILEFRNRASVLLSNDTRHFRYQASSGTEET